MLTNRNGYTLTGPAYNIFPGKIHSQELHNWNHWAEDPKWYYHWKDLNEAWYHFYNTFHKSPPTSEKIIGWYHYWTGGDFTHQLWAYIM